MFSKKITATEVLLGAANATGVPTVVCLHPKDISQHITPSNNTLFVGHASADELVNFAELFALTSGERNRSL